jgi:hypothetical protein
VLVAMGHAWEPLRSDSRAVIALYTIVYAFHMAAFIIISGYFSRSFTRARRRSSGFGRPGGLPGAMVAVVRRADRTGCAVSLMLLPVRLLRSPHHLRAT